MFKSSPSNMSKTAVSQAVMAKAMAAIQQGEGKNERGIPAVTFIKDVADFLKQHDLKIEILFENLSILWNKYNTMMKYVQENKQRDQIKLSELERSLKAVQRLIKLSGQDESLNANFPLSDSVYVDATVPSSNGVVYLMLGAGIVLV